MRASLNEHVEKAVHEMAPDFADFLMRHIRDTVRNWDAREMSRQIELNIGRTCNTSASTARWSAA